MQMMIVHYHLNPGGVTRVIEAQVAGLKSISPDTDMMVLCGNANELPAIQGVTVFHDSSLNYSESMVDEMQHAKEVAAIMAFITGKLSDHAILHIHNPNLGKNPALTIALYNLALQGIPVINHCHDFAEDRPTNLTLLENMIPKFSTLSLQQVMYPDFPWYHFIVLNSCDHNRILKMGIAEARVHLLPNPVFMQKSFHVGNQEILKRNICRALGFNPAKKICTYPVRAIARKNMGEFILLAALFNDVAQFAVTLPPKNPLEIPNYDFWKAFCKKSGLTLKFEAGNSVNHEELINISDFCITTSIREGFGMAYLEPWLAGTPIIGRELTCIINDLRDRGIEFPRLYKNILVETKEGVVDFKDVKQHTQAEIIKSVIQETETRLKIFSLNPFLTTFLDDIPVDIVRKNQQVIVKRFSIEEYGKELFGIYREVSR
jgi:glycosyltransferase involved in cell wall biosynthesis